MVFDFGLPALLPKELGSGALVEAGVGIEPHHWMLMRHPGPPGSFPANLNDSAFRRLP